MLKHNLATRGKKLEDFLKVLNSDAESIKFTTIVEVNE